MTAFATLNGVRVIAGSISVPTYGPWSGDVTLASGPMDTGPVTLVIGNLSLAGTVIRGEPFAGESSFRLVGGAGGWRNGVNAKQYALAQGVKLSVVVNDAALDLGETMGPIPNAIVGTGWVREAAPGSRLLRQLISLGFFPNWYIDPTGKTQLTAWPTTTVQSTFTVIDQKQDRGLITIATEDYASWLPGCTFKAATLSGTYTSSGTAYTMENDGTVRAEVLT